MPFAVDNWIVKCLDKLLYPATFIKLSLQLLHYLQRDRLNSAVLSDTRWHFSSHIIERVGLDVVTVRPLAVLRNICSSNFHEITQP